ncbi:MAG TPA: hypothetical protein PLM33_04905 [Acidobacteriota bacterium]|jgi:hypothetical protein|nr:hypothetical protein [Acidobacteriota bacterium]HRR25826.1 hypothetical protein [Acidobacteriota bacterium]HRR57139.1 hypothetical protein [Acidobacteriota bacterium]HRV08184.1 hypothetical protein [Acidobacteriota bacterium]
MSERVAEPWRKENLWLVTTVTVIVACLGVAWVLHVPAGALFLSLAVGLAVAGGALWAERTHPGWGTLLKICLILGTVGVVFFLVYWRIYWGSEHYFLSQVLGYLLASSLGIAGWSWYRLRRPEA